MFNFKKFFLDLLFPIQCLGCGREEEWLCPKCLSEIKINFNNQPYSAGQLAGVWVAADYNQPLLAKALHCFKYNFIPDLGKELSKLLIEFSADKVKKGEILKFDLVIPVPLAKKRRLWRGFNQAEILARQISQKFGWQFDLDLIYRRHYTHPQVGLKAADRLINVKGIFAVNARRAIKDKKILLVDDVITTGATMQECAEVLKKAGVKEVWGLVLAKG